MSELIVKKVTFGDSTYQQTAGYTGFRNKIVNGDMKVDQEFAAASTPITAGAALKYCLDQWYAFCTGANITTQQVVGAVANTKRLRLTGLASNTGVGVGQRIEAANTTDLSNKTASLSCLLSSSSLTTITWTAYYATTTDTFGTLATPTRTQIATGNFTINSTEAAYQVQISVPAAATTGIEIVFTGGALLASQTLTIGDVQLEKAGAASEFERVPYSEQLRRCQWYYESLTVFIPAVAPVPIRYRMRVTPTVTGNGTATIFNNTPTMLSIQESSGQARVLILTARL